MDKKELILFDSNVIIYIINGDTRTQQELIQLNPDHVFISVITEMEVLIGASNKEMLLQFKKKLKRYNIIHLTAKSSLKASELIKKYRLSHGLDIPDSLIAASALTHNMVLFTKNVKDFKFITNLKIHPL